MANIYENILSIQDTKRFLRLDSDFNDDDSDIERMISSAFGYISNHTSYIFSVQDKTYYPSHHDDYLTIYDYPINTTDFGNLVPLYYSCFIKVKTSEPLTLNVGFASKTNVPAALISAALDMIKVWYYSSETNENTTLLPQSIKEAIDTYRRFIVV